MLAHVLAANPAIAADAVDTAPGIKSKVNPLYPRAAMDARIEGAARYRFSILPEGQTADVELMAEDPKGYGFGEAGLAAIRQWTWVPATAAGAPVRRDGITYTMRWALR